MEQVPDFFLQPHNEWKEPGTCHAFFLTILEQDLPRSVDSHGCAATQVKRSRYPLQPRAQGAGAMLFLRDQMMDGTILLNRGVFLQEMALP